MKRIITKAEYRMTDDGLELLSEKWTEYDGLWAQMKGASDSQRNLQDQQAQFYQTLTNDYNQQFAKQGAILQTLQNSLQPVIDAGANQFGYSKAQTDALNSTAIAAQGGQVLYMRR